MKRRWDREPPASPSILGSTGYDTPGERPIKRPRLVDTPEGMHKQSVPIELTQCEWNDFDDELPKSVHPSHTWNKPMTECPIPFEPETQYTLCSERRSAKRTPKKVRFQLPRRPRMKIAVIKTGYGFRRNPLHLAKSVVITCIKKQFHPSGLVQTRTNPPHETVMLGQQ